MMSTAFSHGVLGSVYAVCSLSGIVLSFYMILHTVQKHFNWGNLVVVACAVTNLVGFAISPSLISASLITVFPLYHSVLPLRVGDLGLTLGFILFSLNFTLHHYKTRKRPLAVTYVILILATSLETCSLIPQLGAAFPSVTLITNIVTMVTTFIVIILNMVVSVLTTRSNGILGYSKLSDHDVIMSPDEVMRKRPRLRSDTLQQGALICLIFITLAVLPKVTYDGLECANNESGQEYFKENAFLMTRSLLYIGAYVQIFCNIRYL